MTDETYAAGVLDAVEDFDPNMVVVGQRGLIHELAQERRIATRSLGFPDRTYESDGLLTSRLMPGAVLDDPEQIARRAVALTLEGEIKSRSGDLVSVKCDAILLHGDNAASVQAARAVRTALEDALRHPRTRKAGKLRDQHTSGRDVREYGDSGLPVAVRGGS